MSTTLVVEPLPLDLYEDAPQPRAGTFGLVARDSVRYPVGPCVHCGERGPDRHDRPGVPWRASGAKYGIDGRVCKRCYDQERSRQKRLGRTEARNTREVHGPVRVLSPSAGGRRFGEHLYRRLHIQCCEVGEFAAWATMALIAQGHGEGTADLDGFCGDADAAWCAVEAASGRCVRQQREAPLLSLVEVVRDGKSLWVPSV